MCNQFLINNELEEKKDYFELVEYRDRVYREEENYFETKGLLKEFQDEYLALCSFAKYSDYPLDHLYRLKIGNQGYDAEVLDANSVHVVFIEFAFVIDGKYYANYKRSLAKDGIVNLNPLMTGSPTVDDLNRARDCLGGVIKNKSTKDYSDCLLIFYLQVTPAVHSIERNESMRIVEEITTTLKKVKFNAQKIFLLIPGLHFLKRV